jgi:hypothetical protein
MKERAMFDTAAGRFLQRDPIGFTAGDVNLYRYVRDAPANATDPSGQEPTTPEKIEAVRNAAELIRTREPGQFGNGVNIAVLRAGLTDPDKQVSQFAEREIRNLVIRGRRAERRLDLEKLDEKTMMKLRIEAEGAKCVYEAFKERLKLPELPKKAPPLDKKIVEKLDYLVNQLGDMNFEVRQKAVDELRKRLEDEASKLEAAEWQYLLTNKDVKAKRKSDPNTNLLLDQLGVP